MFHVEVIPPSQKKVIQATPEGRSYSLDLPGKPSQPLLWTSADKPHLVTEHDDPDMTHHVMVSGVTLNELAALTLAALVELRRLNFFSDDSNGPPPVQCISDIEDYIGRQLVIAHNQAAANEADKKAQEQDPMRLAQADMEDWAGPF